MIRALPQAVIDRIAAGEVVERPASVVKELVENALDAGAGAITVEIEAGGIGLVRVVDDGQGFAADELPLAFASHATSKLTDVEDLYHIASFGFRGEALSSIGAIARCRLTTRQPQADSGWTLECQAGAVSELRPASGPAGTTIEVRDLFFNTPARRRFLGAARTEAARCREILGAIALAHPGVRFTLRTDGKTRVTVDDSDDLLSRVAAVFGRELVDEMVPVEGAREGLSVEGCLTLPSGARARPRTQLVYVNGRLIRDRGIQAAVRSGCKDFLPGALQPAYVLMLTVDPVRLDVNVHPTKAEVRFRERDDVFRLVRSASRQALLAADLAPRVAAPTLGTLMPPMAPPPTVPAGLGFRSGPSEAGVTPSAPSLGHGHVAEAAPSVTPPPTLRPARRYLQVLNTYLVHDGADGLVLVDQHALHERILYARLQNQRNAGQIESQRLLVPETVRLDPGDYERALEQAHELRGLGLQIEAFGPDTVAVHALPAVLRHESVADLLRDVVCPPELHGGIPDGLDRRLFTMACHAAVKAGDPLNEEEVAELFQGGEALEHDATCPHGRPTRLVISGDELEKLFKRTGF